MTRDNHKRTILGRPVAFDREAVLEIAMDFLWKGGFDATPVGDLIETMGLSRSSFYAAFGSKRGVFIEAIELYCHRCLDLLTAIERSDAEPREKLRDMLRSLAMVGDDRGCFLTNCVSAQARHDPAIRQIAADHNTAVERIIMRNLPGSPVDDRPADTRALISAAYGATLLKSLGMDTGAIRELLDTLVDHV